MTDGEKKDIKDFNDYLLDWWKGNLDTVSYDSEYQEVMNKIKSDHEFALARQIGGIDAIKIAQKKFYDELIKEYGSPVKLCLSMFEAITENWTQGVQNPSLRGCICTPFFMLENPCPIRLYGSEPFNDRQGGARGCIVNRV